MIMSDSVVATKKTGPAQAAQNNVEGAQKKYSAAIILIGSEILSGKVIDENGPFLIAQLRCRGIYLNELRIIDDTVQTIAATVQDLSSTNDFVFTTGGIGPTHDDVTIEAVAQAFSVDVVQDSELLRRINKYKKPEKEDGHGAGRGDAIYRLANIPKGAQLTYGDEHILASIQIENTFVFPGVPYLMRRCFDRISKTLPSCKIYSKSLYLNVSETVIADRLRDLASHSPNVAMGSYPRFDDAAYRLRITLDSYDLCAVEKTYAKLLSYCNHAWLVDEQIALGKI